MATLTTLRRDVDVDGGVVLPIHTKIANSALTYIIFMRCHAPFDS